MPETFFTVWSNLFERGGLQSGETLLVHGGASGIGTTAIQLAHAFGARVLATVGSRGEGRRCASGWAQSASINYRAENFADAVREHTSGRGVDVILDIVGGSYLEANIEALAVTEDWSSSACWAGKFRQLSLGRMLSQRLTITASTLRPQTPAEKGRIGAALRERVWPLLGRAHAGASAAGHAAARRCAAAPMRSSRPIRPWARWCSWSIRLSENPSADTDFMSAREVIEAFTRWRAQRCRWCWSR